MMKPFVFSLCACACTTFALADDNAAPAYKWQANWFDSIGTGATIEDMKATNGSWGPLTGATVSGGALTVELDDSEFASFAVAEGVAEDTNTVTKIETTITFTKALEDDLSSLNLTSQQFTLAAVDAETDYYALWTGDEEAGWQTLTGAEPSDAAVAVKFEIDYKVAAAKTLRVWIGGTQMNVGGVTDIPLTSGGTQIAGFSVTGCGTIANVNGAIQLGVASVGGVKYGTITDAVTAATDGAKIEVLRETNESVTLPDNKEVTIADNGKMKDADITVPESKTVTVAPAAAEFTGTELAGKSGEYTIPMKVKGGTLKVDLPSEIAEYKEIAKKDRTDNAVKVTLQTKQSILADVKPDGTKNLMANEAKLRAFLAAKATTAYEAADANAAAIKNAIAESGGNGVPLWQNYVMGTDPEKSLAPIANPAGDKSADGISLVVPALAETLDPSGDYAVSYKVNDTAVTPTAGGVIQVPLATGIYSVKAVLE